MRLHSSSLPKLAVFVNLVCLLTIVLLKSACCVRLYNYCSSQSIAVDRKGRVYARDDISQLYQNFTIKTQNFSGELTIFGEKSRRYLCLKKSRKHWKLIGSRKYRGIGCLYYEEMLENGYTRYRSAVSDGNENRYIGFTSKGDFMNDTREEKLTSSSKECLYFLKLDTKFDINDHNRKVAGLKDNTERVSHHVKIRHKHHRHQNINEIT